MHTECIYALIQMSSPPAPLVTPPRTPHNAPAREEGPLLSATSEDEVIDSPDPSNSSTLEEEEEEEVGTDLAPGPTAVLLAH